MVRLCNLCVLMGYVLVNNVYAQCVGPSGSMGTYYGQGCGVFGQSYGPFVGGGLDPGSCTAYFSFAGAPVGGFIFEGSYWIIGLHLAAIPVQMPCNCGPCMLNVVPLGYPIFVMDRVLSIPNIPRSVVGHTVYVQGSQQFRLGSTRYYDLSHGFRLTFF
jgi:hypothetical protein